jgi:hypothetical protein
VSWDDIIVVVMGEREGGGEIWLVLGIWMGGEKLTDWGRFTE